MSADDEFDANERIAGFSLVRIKSALTHLGIRSDRDDARSIADVLECGRPQATVVLEELERRGLVARKGKGWEKTPLGYGLANEWHPPRTVTPAVKRKPEPDVDGEIFETTRCAIERSADEGETFEEAELDVGMSVHYEGERLVWIEVLRPDEYQGESADSAVGEISVYLTPTEAKAFAKGLQKAIVRAEAEVTQRKTEKGRKSGGSGAKGAKKSKKGRR